MSEHESDDELDALFAQRRETFKGADMPTWDELSIALQPSRPSRAPIWIGVALATAACALFVWQRPVAPKALPVAPAAALPEAKELHVSVDELQTQRTYSFPVNPLGLVVRVSDPAGNIRVKAGAADRVVLRAKMEIEAPFDGDGLIVKPSLSDITISTGMDLHSTVDTPDVNIELEVPAAASLELSSGHGDLRVDGIVGHQQIEAGYGKVFTSGGRDLRIDKSKPGEIYIAGFEGRGHSEVWAGEAADVAFWGRCGVGCDLRIVTEGKVALRPERDSSLELALERPPRHFRDGAVEGFGTSPIDEGAATDGWKADGELIRFRSGPGGRVTVVAQFPHPILRSFSSSTAYP